MFIGHLPAGYVLAKQSYSKFHKNIKNYRAFMFCGILGSIAPDLDMFYFYFVDYSQTHHHTYFSHYPILWGTLFLLCLCLCLFRGSTRKGISSYSLIFSASGFFHLILDSIVGNICWLAPFSNRPFSLATVWPIHEPWWMNFLLHWSFTLEICLVAYASWVFIRPLSHHSFQNLGSRL